MIQRQALHSLLDELPDSDLAIATRILEGLRATAGDPLMKVLDQAPIDDEPDDDNFDGGLDEARRGAENNLGMSASELRRELGLR